VRILIVEDDAIIALDIEDILLQGGHEVVGVAPSAAEALALARRERPDLALMDHRLLGNVTGTEAAERIWKELRIPSLFVSGNAGEISGTPPSVLGIFRKPIDHDRLLFAVEAIAQSGPGKS
jgi:CheY-like chemotaxis protein